MLIIYYLARHFETFPNPQHLSFATFRSPWKPIKSPTSEERIRARKMTILSFVNCRKQLSECNEIPSGHNTSVWSHPRWALNACTVTTTTTAHTHSTHQTLSCILHFVSAVRVIKKDYHNEIRIQLCMYVYVTHSRKCIRALTRSKGYTVDREGTSLVLVTRVSLAKSRGSTRSWIHMYIRVCAPHRCTRVPVYALDRWKVHGMQREETSFLRWFATIRDEVLQRVHTSARGLSIIGSRSTSLPLPTLILECERLGASRHVPGGMHGRPWRNTPGNGTMNFCVIAQRYAVLEVPLRHGEDHRFVINTLSAVCFICDMLLWKIERCQSCNWSPGNAGRWLMFQLNMYCSILTTILK